MVEGKAMSKGRSEAAAGGNSRGRWETGRRVGMGGGGLGGWERVGVMRWDWGWDDKDKEGVSDRTLNGGAGNGVGGERRRVGLRLCSLLP